MTTSLIWHGTMPAKEANKVPQGQGGHQKGLDRNVKALLQGKIGDKMSSDANG